MTRRKNEDPNVKPGKKSWVSGTKLRFLQSHNAAWESASREGPDAATVFYSNMAKLWIKKYGWHFNHEDDLEVDTPDPLLDTLGEPEEPVDDEEAARRREYNDTMRKRVSTVDTAKEMVQILETAADANPKPPRRQQLLQYYSSLYYGRRIKATVDAEWAAMKRCSNDSEAEEKVKFVDFQNKVKRRFFNSETQTFRDNLKKQLEMEHQARVQEFEARADRTASLDKEDCAETYHSRLSTAGATLSNLCEALGKQYGMNVSILLCGPIGAGGKIEMRSVHYGLTKDLNPKKWPQARREEFQKVQESMVGFTQRCYTLQECIERSLSHPGPNASVDAGSGEPGFYSQDEDLGLSTSPAAEATNLSASLATHTPSANPSGSISTAPSRNNSVAPSRSSGVVPSGANTIAPSLNEGIAPSNANIIPPARSGSIVPAFDPLNVGWQDEAEPPSGFDHISTNILGEPENLTLLTEGLHDGHDEWGAFKELMNEHQESSATLSALDPALSNYPLPSPDAAAATLNLQFDLSNFNFNPLVPFESTDAASDVGGAIPSAESFTPPVAVPENVNGTWAAPSMDATLALQSQTEALPNTETQEIALSADSAPVDALPLDSTRPKAPCITPSPSRASPSSSDGAPTQMDVAGAPLQVAASVEFPDCPSASKAWYAPIFSVADKFGAEFRACIGSFLRLERAAGWTSKDNRLPSARRPAEYKDWMQRARPAEFNKITANFGERLWDWWVSLQPAARVDESLQLMRSGFGELDWGTVAMPGKSGIFLFVLGLYWWALVDGGCGKDRWRELAADVEWVCEEIVKSGRFSASDAAPAKPTAARSTLKKRKPEDPPKFDASRRRKSARN
ncbi:hypothetical protein HWV62_29302 [Athelia sp. TMB]|nr:hypothetical protein HWV62_29302 [Athelia sp. TMB]